MRQVDDEQAMPVLSNGRGICHAFGNMWRESDRPIAEFNRSLRANYRPGHGIE